MNGLEQPIDLYLNGELVTDLVIPEGIEWIRRNAFHGFTSIESVTVPSSLTSIGVAAFADCVNIKRVYTDSIESWCSIDFDGSSSNPLYNSADLYVGGEQVKDLLITDDTQGINAYAFYGCKSLRNVMIRDVKYVGDYAFADCDRMLSIRISGYELKVGTGIIYGCDMLVEMINHTYCDNEEFEGYAAIVHNDLQSRLDYVDGCVFYAKDGVAYLADYVGESKDVVLPTWGGNGNEINSFGYVIGDHLFEGRDDITSITIPHYVSSVGKYAFSSCPNLKKVEIVCGSIGAYAFADCPALTEVVFSSNGHASLGSRAFENCEAIETVDIKDLGTWCNYTFEDWRANPLYYADTMLVNGEAVSNLVIPEHQFSIAAYAFSGCNSVRTVTGSSTLKYINENAFYDCNNIYSVNLPYIKQISSYGFNSCDGIVSVTLGKGLETLNSKSFGYDARICEVINLSSLEIKPTDVARHVIDVHTGESRIEHKDDFIYYTALNGQRYLVGYSGDGGHITLPVSTADNGYEMLRHAFSGYSHIDSITVPTGVTAFSEGAFLYTYIDNLYIEDLSAWCAIEMHTPADTYEMNSANPMAFASHVFVGGKEVTEIVIPADVTYIAPFVFTGNMIKSVIIDGDCELKIGEYAFSNCSSLERVALGGNVIEIGEYAFYRDSAIKEIRFGEGIVELGESAFAYTGATVSEIKLPEGLVRIDYGAFSSMNIGKLYIPSTLESIGNYTFSRANHDTTAAIEEVHIGDLETWFEIRFGDENDGGNSNGSANPLSVGAALFVDGELITELVIPESVTEIGARALMGYQYVTSVMLHSGVAYIGDGAFYRCGALERVYADSLEHWMRLEFSSFEANPLINGSDLYVGGEIFTTFVIPEDMTEVIGNTFAGCTSLTDIVFHANVKEIGDMFYQCQNIKNIYLTDLAAWCGIDSYKIPRSEEGVDFYLDGELIVDLVIPEKVTSIKGTAFSGCKSIKSVYIHERVTYINENVFYECVNLERVELEKTTDWWTSWKYGSTNWYELDDYVYPGNAEKLATHMVKGHNQVWWNTKTPWY